MRKKLLSALFALAAVSGLAFAFSACAPQDELQPEGHTHEFADAWSADSENHWHAAVCGHDENDGLAAHVLENGVCTVCGYTVEGTAGLEYALSDDGSRYTVSGIGTATAANITVPSIHNDLPVEAIGESAFEGCTSLKSVILPDSITAVDKDAFGGCSSLETVYYAGGKEDFEKIDIGINNSNFETAEIIFDYLPQF